MTIFSAIIYIEQKGMVMNLNGLFYIVLGVCCAYTLFFGYCFSFKVSSYIRVLSSASQSVFPQPKVNCGKEYEYIYTKQMSQIMNAGGKQKLGNQKCFAHINASVSSARKQAEAYEPKLSYPSARFHAEHAEASEVCAYTIKTTVAILHGLKRKKQLQDAY